MDTPSELLAERVLERLIAEKLLSASDAKKMAAKMAAGKLRPEDWRLPIEMAGEKETRK